MLKLVNIKKDYVVADESVHALKGISINFRKSEFVSILGPSGCGKTTLLNIIGGLDKYTSGDLVIEGVSTSKFTDRDWDTYRNHSIGFIFQSYHLIPHQTILQNVELALMIAGVSRRERRRRALEALDKVGLKDKINNRPNQLSGGQAQRVAIARALINDPEIVLADEPTGALDSVTSVQIMELLKEISKDRLVIMVTHNPDLAYKYSTRIVRLKDGVMTGDSSPYAGDSEAKELTKQQLKERRKAKGSKKKTSMPLLMAMSLSFKNLLSKRRRTAMVAVAGSIGIIGVSMVLSISAGVNSYIASMQDDMLSGNPVSVTQTAIDYTQLLNLSSSSNSPKVDITKLDDKLYIQSLMDTLGSFSQGFSKTNNITEAYLAYLKGIPQENVQVIQYGYDMDVANNIYTDFAVDATTEDEATRTTSVTAIRGMYTQILSEQEDYKDFAGTVSTVATFDEIPNNYNYILSQYDIIAAETPDGVTYDASSLTDEQIKAIFEDKQSLVMVVSENEVTDLVMGQFGYLTQREFLNYAFKAVDSDMYDEQLGLVGSGLNANGEAYSENGFDMTKFIGPDSKKFTWYPNNQVYSQINGMYYYRPYLQDNFFYSEYEYEGQHFVTDIPDLGDVDASTGLELGVKVILEKKKDVSYGCLQSGFYYTNALTQYVREDSMDSDIVKYIEATPSGEVPAIGYSFYYTAFEQGEGGETVKSANKGNGYVYDSGSLMDMITSGLGGGNSGIQGLPMVKASLFGGGDMPSSIKIYPTDFDSKTAITDYLDGWNAMCEEGATYTYTADDAQQSVVLAEADKITYTDTVGLIISMVNTMIQMITTALIAFTALSLVVSTVMIGIITYVSVVERVKEIGILRSVGARKKDIKRLFNAETFIIGLLAGIFGILITYLLSFIVNIIVVAVAGFWGIAALPWWQALIMIALSIVLTLISGLIPAAAAAKKDPVVALRTE